MQMMMRQLVVSAEALTVLSRTALRAPAAFKVGEFMATTDVKLTRFREARQALIEKYKGTMQGVVVQFKDTKTREKFEKEMDELMDVEVSLPDLSLTPGDLAQDATLEPRFIVALGWAFGIQPQDGE